ncbi:hypothetical protein HN51_059148 [Arachis hypogaea]|uniref:Uroporphyrinogen decarboxylase (URO-D) domain-containing protein n=1 Tax=Arachis hypogaea TaxID=3818 RepID=A0A444X4A3_ARAHY|nr:hypothetical protein Ahy_B10g103855 [Arachis hypogaea]
MRKEEVASVAAKPSLAGLGSPSPLSCVPPLASGSPLSWPAWKEACATLQKLLSDPLLVKAARGEPVIQSPIHSEEGLKALHPIDLEKLSFIGDSLKKLRKEVGGDASVLGFMGAPWTIATYIVEGGTTRTYTTIKSMCHTAPHLLRTLLSHLGQAIADYVVFQVEYGTHCIQIFDSWGGQLPPDMRERWSKSYIKEIIDLVKKRYPETPIVLYINGNGGLLERMKDTGVDVIGLD